MLSWGLGFDNSSTIQHFNISTAQQFNCSTVQQSYYPRALGSWATTVLGPFTFRTRRFLSWVFATFYINYNGTFSTHTYSKTYIYCWGVVTPIPKDWNTVLKNVHLGAARIKVWLSLLIQFQLQFDQFVQDLQQRFILVKIPAIM